MQTILGHLYAKSYSNQFFIFFLNFTALGRSFVKSNSINIALPVRVVDLNPINHSDSYTASVLRYIFDTFFYLSESKGFSSNVFSKWEKLSQGRLYRLTLKKGLMFHNGVLVSSDDVIFSLQNCLKKDSSSFGGTDNQPTFKKIDDMTVSISFKEPNEHFFIALQGYQFSLIPGNYGGVSESEFAQSPVGTGKFQFVLNDGRIISLKRRHPKEGKPDFINFFMEFKKDFLYKKRKSIEIHDFNYFTTSYFSTYEDITRIPKKGRF